MGGGQINTPLSIISMTDTKLETALRYINLLKSEKEEFLKIRAIAEAKIKDQAAENMHLKEKILKLQTEVHEVRQKVIDIRRLSKEEKLKIRQDEEVIRLNNLVSKLKSKIKQLSRDKESLIFKLNRKEN